MYSTYLYIDYENVQDVDLTLVKEDTKVVIIIGEDQNKLPFRLIKETQPKGDSVQWIQVPGKGKNALDFFIAYFLGCNNSTDKKYSHIIYSKDTGFDPLINYLTQNNTIVKRIVSLKLLDEEKEIKFDDAKIKKTLENLKKMQAAKRPKKRSGLESHIKTVFNNQIDEANLSALIEQLFIKKYIFEENNNIKYKIDE